MIRTKLFMAYLFFSIGTIGYCGLPIHEIAKNGLSTWLDNIPKGEEADYGFIEPIDKDRITLGNPIKVYEFIPDFRQTRKENIYSYLEKIDEFLVPIKNDGEIISLLTIAKLSENDSYEIHGIGSAKIAKSLSNTLEAISQYQKKPTKIVRDLELKTAYLFDYKAKNLSNNLRFWLVHESNSFHNGIESSFQIFDIINNKHLQTDSTENYGKTNFLNLEGSSPENQNLECKSNISAERSSINEDDAETSAMRDWSKNAINKFGLDFGRWGSAKNSSIVCKPRGQKLFVCTAKGKPCRSGDSSSKLGVKYYKQKESNWCWAGVSQSIVNYYKKDKVKKQCKIVNFGLGRKDCCDKPSSKKCNKPNSRTKLVEIMKKYKNNGKKVGKLTMKELSAQLKKKRPGVVLWKWEDKKVGHFVVYRGMKDTTVHIVDPNRGKSSITYKSLSKSGKRKWISTVTTKK